MRHRNKGRQLGRNTKHRRALFRNLVTSLLEHERIETTEAKAKEVRGFTDRMITLGKQGDLPARRSALGFLQSKDVVAKLFSDVAGRFRDRNGGYTRTIKTRRQIALLAEGDHAVGEPANLLGLRLGRLDPLMLEQRGHQVPEQRPAVFGIAA